MVADNEFEVNFLKNEMADIFLENLFDFDKKEKKVVFRVADIEFKVNFWKSQMAGPKWRIFFRET